MILMRRKADGMVRVTITEKIDLVQFDIAVFSRIKRDTMINREGNMTVLEKSNQIVDVL